VAGRCSRTLIATDDQELARSLAGRLAQLQEFTPAAVADNYGDAVLQTERLAVNVVIEALGEGCVATISRRRSLTDGSGRDFQPVAFIRKDDAALLADLAVMLSTVTVESHLYSG